MRKEVYLWDKVAKSFHAGSYKSKAHKDKYSKVAEIIFEINPKNILDLGCGSGILERELLDRGYKGSIIGLDASRSMLEIANNFAKGENIAFNQADLDDKFTNYPKFECIIAINVLFFLEKKELFMDNIAKSLKDKKSLFILISAKPLEETSIISFIKAHFENTSKKEKILIFINEIFNIPRFVKMALNQRELDKLEKKGKLKCDNIEEIKNLAKNAGLKVEAVQDIHAKQNWLFFIRKA